MSTAKCLVILLTFVPLSTSVKCYVGSRGTVNGENVSNFVTQECDEEMEYCFESFNSLLTDVTASCQTLNTDPRNLELCKAENKCKTRSEIDVTVCCCTTDLCNLHEVLRPTGESPVESGIPADGQ